MGLSIISHPFWGTSMTTMESPIIPQETLVATGSHLGVSGPALSDASWELPEAAEAAEDIGVEGVEGVANESAPAPLIL